MKQTLLFSFIFFLLFSGCQSLKKSTDKEVSELPKYMDGYEISFSGYGHEPEWNVKIMDGKIIYRNINFPDSMGFTGVRSENTSDGNGVTFFGKSDRGEDIRIEILREKCQDSMADIDYDCQVKVFLSNQRVDSPGCGKFEEDPRLNKEWTLETMNGKSVAELPNGKVPFIRFNPKKDILSADMGCNGISVGYSLLLNEVYFSTGLARTMMYCDGVMELEEQFSQMVTGKIIVYSFKGNRLFFHTKENIQLASFKMK